MIDSPINILLVEDDQDLNETITRFLRFAGNQVTSTFNAKEFNDCLALNSFDIAVIDIGLPDESGLMLAERLRKTSDIGIIILTAHAEIDDRVQGYAVGADLYMVKPVVMVELAAAINSIAKRRLERQSTPATPISTWVLARSSRHLISPEGTVISLSAKEFDLLFLLVNAQGQPVKRKDLTAALHYPNDLYGGRALDNLVRRIRVKIRSQAGVDDLIHTFHSQGFYISAEVIVR
jgi:DNA-binding response OmpR family regulator